jgi:Predicted nucleoside-diphosphate sugar epimerases
VKNIVVLSTDKACYPINAMGISKAMMEKVAIAKGRALGPDAVTTICCTRYGNVMASRGSVIPLWIDQIKADKDITLTDPNMTRFMMTLDDAVDLVLYAFQHGKNGDLFVQKAPAATLDILSRALIDLYHSKTKVRVIGTRHGEKLYETLVTREEMANSEDMGNYFRIPCDERDLNYDKYFIEGSQLISNSKDYHSHNTYQLDLEGMRRLLASLDMVMEDDILDFNNDEDAFLADIEPVLEDYHSHNTFRLDFKGMQQLLLKIDMVREDLQQFEKEKEEEKKKMHELINK